MVFATDKLRTGDKVHQFLRFRNIFPLIVTNSWSYVEIDGSFIPPARDGHSAVLYKDSMIIFAGFEEDNQRFSQV
jgi:hypothetical protein